MLDIDKLLRSHTANTYGYKSHIQNLFAEYTGNIPYDDPKSKDAWDEYIKCILSREYLMNSRFYQYLLSKERTELIDKILNGKFQH